MILMSITMIALAWLKKQTNHKCITNCWICYVTEFIEGLVETYPGLQYLDGVKVVLRADVSGATYDKVALYQPAHAGFVGEGMLTAAICGDIFASPPVDYSFRYTNVNYTGDRLNFGLAAEQAKSEGYKVEMVIVDDDCALPPPRGISGRRGLAGTILVQSCYYESQVAGAAAAAGLSLSEVAAEAKRASEMVALYITVQACEFDLKRIVVPIKISWVPPSESFVKSNSDASWDWNQKQWTAAVIARGEMAIFNLLRFCL
ncbi:hypothetical protein OROGR_009493 [Orobanche gracilis]